MDLFTKIDQLKAALDRKDELKRQTTENNKLIESLTDETAKMMIDEECPCISRNGYKYTLQNRIYYSKRSDEDLQKAGIDFIQLIRKAGFGDLVSETVNSKSLQSSLTNYVDEHNELPSIILPALNVYEKYGVQKRKETNEVGKKKVAK